MSGTERYVRYCAIQWYCAVLCGTARDCVVLPCRTVWYCEYCAVLFGTVRHCAVQRRLYGEAGADLDHAARAEPVL